MTPAQFSAALQKSEAAARDYVWLYGFGSAWQTDGPYGLGPVVANFKQYKAVIHRAEAACSAPGAPAAAD